MPRGIPAKKPGARRLDDDFEKEWAEFQSTGDSIMGQTDRLLAQAGSALVEAQHQRDQKKATRTAFDALITAMLPAADGVVNVKEIAAALEFAKQARIKIDEDHKAHVEYLQQQEEKRQSAAEAAARAVGKQAGGQPQNNEPPGKQGQASLISVLENAEHTELKETKPEEAEGESGFRGRGR